MTNEETKKLCLRLMHADTGEEVIQILKTTGYWDDPTAWRLYGDDEGNYASAGNQSERSDFAFVEKLVNSIDSTLIGACYRLGIDPKSPEAPKTMHDAVALFYEDGFSNEEGAGRIAGWTTKMRREAAKNITVAATGRVGRKNAILSLTVADKGEGQSPDMFPETFLSLGMGNKASIHFVQGLWNMGGTSALRFCGYHNLQLIISRRDPEASNPKNTSDEWGFSIVRRENPRKFERRSQYKFLAPLEVRGEERRGVLRLNAKSLPIFPEKIGRMPVSRNGVHSSSSTTTRTLDTRKAMSSAVAVSLRDWTYCSPNARFQYLSTNAGNRAGLGHTAVASIHRCPASPPASPATDPRISSSIPSVSR